MSNSPKHHIDRMKAALALLDEARGFAAMSPQGRENIIEVSDMLPGLIEQAYRSGFLDGEQHAQERKGNSSFVPVPDKGTIVPPSEEITQLEATVAELREQLFLTAEKLTREGVEELCSEIEDQRCHEGDAIEQIL